MNRTFRKSMGLVAGCTALLSVLAGLGIASAAAPSRPNIIFILTDDQGTSAHP